MAISEKDLDDLDAAHKRTTKGSWVPFPLTNGYHDVRVQESDGIWESIGCTEESSDNGSFCCLAHEQVPALIAEARRLRDENAELRDEVTENDELRPMVSDSLSELVGELQGRLDGLNAEVRQLREEIDEWHRISERWGRAFGREYGKFDAIRDLANARLADTAHMASIQEAETLWAIVNATKGE